MTEKPLPLPRVVDGTAAPGPGEGWVVPDFAQGAVVVRAPDESLVRLSWEEGAASADRRRALAPGRYALVGYRLIRRDEGGKTWHVSVSALKDRTFEVEAGREHALAIDPTIRIVERFQPDGAGVSVQGVNQAGLSIYKEGKRIPLGFRRLDGAGRTLAEGKITYG